MNQLDSEITALSNSLLYELTKALGLNQNSIIGRALCPLFKKATLKFAEIGVGLDRVVAESGVVYYWSNAVNFCIENDNQTLG